MSATCDGVRVTSVYAPNGRVPDSEHYHYKLAWFAALANVLASESRSNVVCGDMNIAPTDADVFDPQAYVGQTHVTPPERAALATLQAAACGTWCANTGRPSACSRTGTTARACSTKTWACASTWCWPARRSPTG